MTQNCAGGIATAGVIGDRVLEPIRVTERVLAPIRVTYDTTTTTTTTTEQLPANNICHMILCNNRIV
jgi:uncharacterized membrane protein affecting hemolysin expression